MCLVENNVIINGIEEKSIEGFNIQVLVKILKIVFIMDFEMCEENMNSISNVVL